MLRSTRAIRSSFQLVEVRWMSWSMVVCSRRAPLTSASANALVSSSTGSKCAHRPASTSAGVPPLVSSW